MLYRVEILELYHLAVTVDLGLDRPVEEKDVQRWVIQLMSRRAREIHDGLSRLLPPTETKPSGEFTFSFEPAEGDLEADEDDMEGNEP